MSRAELFENICKEAGSCDLGARVDYRDLGYTVLFMIDHTYGKYFDAVCNKILEKIQALKGTKINRVDYGWFGGIEAEILYGLV